MSHWSTEAVFYHIYPLGLCGAPRRNDFSAAPAARLEQLYPWLEHIQQLGATALYLGPLFESSAHGYDTADYYWVDRRLGSNEALAAFSAEAHRRGLRLVLDGVFNHVGRSFWAFRDVQANRQSSPYCDWFVNLRFDRPGPAGDYISYEGWNGHYDLVKLNLGNPQVREHLFGAVETWVRQFDIDGLRLDTADCLDFDFLRALASFCCTLKPDFWLMGEVIHGDYRRWANPQMLDSTTNYECYKGLWSSLNDGNYFEIAYALNRQFGPGGLYRGLTLYNFVDNHDVDRAASSLANPRHLFLLYAMLFSMPGAPAVYYGSEWGAAGRRLNNSDLPLRPQLDLAAVAQRPPQPGFEQDIARLAHLRRATPALMHGSYEQLHMAARQMAFLRQYGDQRLVAAFNSADEWVDLPLRLTGEGIMMDLLDPAGRFALGGGAATVSLPPYSARWMQVEG